MRLIDNKTVALVVPCFNEENRLPISYWRELVRIENEVDWIFVNDGGTDGTSLRLNEIVSGTSARVINCLTNSGKGNAIRAGFLSVLESKPEIEILGYIDCDGAFSQKDILSIMELATAKFVPFAGSLFDSIVSSRVALAGHQIKRDSLRHYLGRVIATILTSSWEGAPYDTQSGFKLFRNSNSFKNAVNQEFKTKWFVDIELLTRIGINNGGALNIWEEPLTSWRDVEDSKLSMKNAPLLLSEIAIARREVLRFIKKRKSQNGSH